MTIYHQYFECREDVEKEFNEKLDDDINILFAYYGSDGCYGGEAFVLFERDGMLFEVNGSHCSCNGLEDWWDPEQTFYEALEKRFSLKELYSCFEEDYGDQILEIAKPWRVNND